MNKLTKELKELESDLNLGLFRETSIAMKVSGIVPKLVAAIEAGEKLAEGVEKSTHGGTLVTALTALYEYRKAMKEL
jgi:hypothetical protein